MSKTLIVKLGAAGDVVRTTPLLRLLADHEVEWITSPASAPLLSGTLARVHASAAEIPVGAFYDLVISLEEDFEQLSQIHSRLRCRQIIGAYPASAGRVHYTPELRDWYDMSLISTYGLREANRLKLLNRRSYQEILFAGLGAQFNGEEYILPPPPDTGMRGDIALIDVAGGRWSNKQWRHFASLAVQLAEFGRVNILPWRNSVLDHLADINGHRIIVSLDSLPLHLGLGLKKTTFGIFNCTSPWEIYPYGRMTRLISPRLEEFYYLTQPHVDATQALAVDDVFDAVRMTLSRSAA